MFTLKSVLMMPEDGNDSLGGSTGLGEDLSYLESDEVTPPGKDVTHDEDETEEHPPEPGEGTGDDKEEDEETEEPGAPKELAPHERPTYTDLKNYDAELFKNFPGLKDVIFREKAYTDLFSSIEDARSAQTNSEALENFRADIFDGDGSKLFSSIKDTNAEALPKFAARILPTLYKVDQDAHWAAANPLLESMVKGFAKAGGADEDVKKAAELFAKYVFGDQADDILAGRKTFIQQATERKVDPERVKFERERFQAFDGDIMSMRSSGMKDLIMSKDKSGKLRLDPDDELSDWVRNTLVEKIDVEVGKEMAADKDHIRYMDGLWAKAKKDGYSSEWKSRIINAYLARARQLVPAVRSRLRSEVMGTQVRRSDKQKQIVNRNRRPEPGGGGSQSRSRNGGIDSSRRIDYSKTSDDDILNDNITYK